MHRGGAAELRGPHRREPPGGCLVRLENGAHRTAGIRDPYATESASEALIIPQGPGGRILWTTECSGAIYRHNPADESFTREFAPGGPTSNAWSMGIAANDNFDKVLATCNVEADRSCHLLARDMVAKSWRTVARYPGFNSYGLAWAGTLGWLVWGHEGDRAQLRMIDSTGHVRVTAYPSSEISGGYFWRGGWIPTPAWGGNGRFVVGRRDDASLWAWNNTATLEFVHRFPAKRIDRIVLWRDTAWFPCDNGALYRSDLDLTAFEPDHEWPGWHCRATSPTPDGARLLCYLSRSDGSMTECWTRVP